MKRKGFYVLATVAMLALAAGCGSNQGEETSENQVTEAVSPTEAPEATVTPEPTATPAPTAAPVAANDMEGNGIEVLGAGWHTAKGFMVKDVDENGNPILGLADCEYCFEVTEAENDGSTKVIQAVLYVKPYVPENGLWSTFAMGGFVDLKTGKAFLPMDEELLQTTLLKQDGKEYELQLSMEFEGVSTTRPYYTERYTLVCPSDYDDAGFYLTGYAYDWEAFIERAGLWKKLNFIRHEESDMVVFGVNQGLETEPAKKPVVGAELAVENYFEVNGYSTLGEGTYTWQGMEALKKRNAETGYWETVSLEEKELTNTISIEEESLGDGTKRIKLTSVDMAEYLSEDEARVPYSRGGMVDKKTGVVYMPRMYGLAEEYVLAKDGEEISIIVATESVQEDLDDGKVRIEYSCMVICPEDFDDIVFYVTCNAEIREDENTYSNEPEVFSLDEIERGDCDLLFFR